MEGLAGLLLLGITVGGMNTPEGRMSDAAVFEHDTGWLSTDKGGHFLAGTGVAMVTRAVAYEYTDWNDRQVFLAGCAASTTVGVLKELYDRDVMGTYIEHKDIVWTAAGCLLTFNWAF